MFAGLNTVTRRLLAGNMLDFCMRTLTLSSQLTPKDITVVYTSMSRMRQKGDRKVSYQ